MPGALRTLAELEVEMVAADLDYRLALLADDVAAAAAAGERFDAAMALWRSIPKPREA